jgi:hypothetical protein
MLRKRRIWGLIVDSIRFDRWTKTLSSSRSRRGLLGALAGGVVMLAVGRRASAQDATPGGMCGGLAGLPCPAGFECVNDPSDSCDPATGGADCSGICRPIDENPCAAVLCIEGTTCCPQCGGICIPNYIACSEDLCFSEPCNQVTCGPGEYCCNESCSLCVALGQVCTDEYCPPEQPGGEACGTSVCGQGEYCCNESCGICAPLGGGCIELFCDPPPGRGVPCGPTICPPGEICCNESCGICTPPDGMCIMIACLD